MSAADWASGRILVLGAEGMLGHELMDAFRNRLGERADEHLTGWDKDQLDLCDHDAVTNALGELKPSIIVNAAAYTDVDGCETEVALAMAVNAQAPGHLANTCHQIDATMVHVGTDFVFDGESGRPYREDDAANPLSVYGRSKWDGEEAVRATGCRHLIVRTSWLFGPYGKNFVTAILSRAKAGQPLSVVTDEVGSPTLAVDLADAVGRLLDAGARGTVHFANSDHCSRFTFAEEIVRQAGLNVTIQAITSENLEQPARRPPYSVLDTARYAKLTGHTAATWQDALRRDAEARRTLG